MASRLHAPPGDAAAGGKRQARAPRRTQVDQLAQFACGARFEDISEPAREQLTLRVLDWLGCALGALDGEPARMIAEQVREFGGAPLVTLIGAGKNARDRAALYNGALVRYLDFNDSYLAPGETCHPSDSLAPVLAASEYAHADGRTLLAALAVAYQVQVRPDDELTKRFPDEHSARIRVYMRDGRVLEREQHDDEGFHTRPMSWGAVADKFDRLASGHVDDRLRARIKDAVARLEAITSDELSSELAAVPSLVERQSQ